jgi:hypothetical protein
MSEPCLPTRYHVEFYTTSLYGDPFYAAELKSPISSVSVGDEFETRTFDDFPLTVSEGSVGFIEKVQHIFWEVKGSHFGHKLMLVIGIKVRD